MKANRPQSWRFALQLAEHPLNSVEVDESGARGIDSHPGSGAWVGVLIITRQGGRCRSPSGGHRHVRPSRRVLGHRTPHRTGTIDLSHQSCERRRVQQSDRVPHYGMLTSPQGARNRSSSQSTNGCESTCKTDSPDTSMSKTEQWSPDRMSRDGKAVTSLGIAIVVGMPGVHSRSRRDGASTSFLAIAVVERAGRGTVLHAG